MLFKEAGTSSSHSYATISSSSFWSSHSYSTISSSSVWFGPVCRESALCATLSFWNTCHCLFVAYLSEDELGLCLMWGVRITKPSLIKVRVRVSVCDLCRWPFYRCCPQSSRYLSGHVCLVSALCANTMLHCCYW